MAAIAAENVAGWPVGRPFAVAPKMSQITLEVILRTVIGASDPARLAALREVMPRLLTVGPWASLAIAKPSLQQRRPWRRLRRAHRGSRPAAVRRDRRAPRRSEPGRADRCAGDAHPGAWRRRGA